MSRKIRLTIAGIGVAIVLCTIATLLASGRTATHTAATDGIPTARVQRGDLDLRVYSNGELHAVNSITMTAPPIGGGSLKITRLLRTGSTAKKGDVVMEFDPSEQQFKVDQNLSELRQAEQEIAKAQADATVQAAKDKVALLKARYDVRRAELDVQQNELLSSIGAHKNDVALEQKRRALEELTENIKSHSISGQATIQLAEEKSNKAKLAMEEARQNIAKLRVLSPMDGLVAVNRNSNDMVFQRSSVPEYHVGDQVQAGGPIMQIIDPTALEMDGNAVENERANVRVGQAVEVKLDAWPGQVFQGTIKSVGDLARRPFWDVAANGTFPFKVQFASSDPKWRQGLTAHAVVLGERRKNVLYIPREALFAKESKRLVYVRAGSGFEARELKVQSENESRSAVEGLGEGTEVALTDPTLPRKATSARTESGGAP